MIESSLLQGRVCTRGGAWLMGLLAVTIQTVDACAADRAIYRCTVNGVAVFSDTPCATDAQIYELDTSRISTYSSAATVNAQVSPVRIKNKPPRARTVDSIATDQARHAAQCVKISDSLRELRSKMRAGYGAKQGERLRERQLKLENRRRTEKCR
jgi:hypothetical protein